MKRSQQHLLQLLAVLVFTCAAAGAFAQGPPPPPPPPPLGPPPPPNPGNPLTPAKINLGKVLFWDEQLSSSRTVSCGTCHISKSGGADPRSATSALALAPGLDGIYGNADDTLGSPGVPLADANGFYMMSTHFGIGVQATTRRTMTSINAAYSNLLFWDGRATATFTDPITNTVVLPNAAALESQSMGPPANAVEMGHQSRTWTEIVERIGAAEPLALATEAPSALLLWVNGRGYPELFAEAFGSNEITAARVGMAIASYERTLFTNQTPFDDFNGGNASALTQQEQNGRTVFVTSGCAVCHGGPLLTDQQFKYTGVRPAAEDEGRFIVTGNNGDHGRMRTPGLRNLELRAPYMHNGRFPTIESVVDFYDRGGDFTAPNKDPAVRPLNLTANQKADLVAFLKRPLTDLRLVRGDYPFDRPTLYSESSRVPVVEGSGLAGSGGLEPMVVAVEPAMIGNPSFAVGVQNALGGAAALLVIGDADPGLTPPASGSFAFENVVLGGSGNGNGFGSAHVAVANDLTLSGKEFFGRWYVTDPAAAGGVAVSPVFHFKVFPPLSVASVWYDNFETGDTSRWSVVVQ